MASKTRIVGFNPSQLKKNLEGYVIQVQTRRLIEYAKAKVIEIGRKIRSYNSRHHMDRTGNLLDSLCWCVSYRGMAMDWGYFQNRATELSYIHEWSEYSGAYPVGGHTLAENYIHQYGSVFTPGWRVFFAILAPYWGYWEEGFKMVGAGGRSGIPRFTRFLKFSVMTETYDVVARELQPATVTFRTEAPTYTNSYEIKGVKVKGSLERRWRRYDNAKYDPYRKYPNKRYHYK